MNLFIAMKLILHLSRTVLLAGSVFVFLAYTSAHANDEVYDPLIKLNRAVFEFNEGFDRYFLKPAAKGLSLIHI